MVVHRVKGRKLGRPTDERVALLRGLVRELILRERIRTTEARAKEARRLAERIITYGKGRTLHHRRLMLRELPDREVMRKVFDVLADRYADRPGGYVRIVKLGPRKGDSAPMVLMELV